LSARKRRLKKSRLLLLVLIIALAINYDNILKTFYPFPYRQTIIKYSDNANIDPCFLTAVMKAGSQFNPGALSPKGARGLMQIMPETGAWIAQQINLQPFHPEQLFDPETNIRLGTWYLANLESEFAGNRVIVLAAYNGGRGNVHKWLKEDKISESISDIEMIPFPETKNFVRKVLWNYKIYKWLYSDDVRNNG